MEPGWRRGACGITLAPESSGEERARLDMEYVTKWSVANDLWILILTIPAVLRRRGAY